MPKNNKPRKKYRPRTIRVGPYYTDDDRQRIANKLNDVTLYVECALPAGNATHEQIGWIEDVINWSLGIFYKRYKYLDLSELAAVWPTVYDGVRAIKSVINRYESGKSSGYVAAGDEINALSKCMAFVVPLLKDALELAPLQTLNEFTWAKQTAIRNYKERHRSSHEKTQL